MYQLLTKIDCNFKLYKTKDYLTHRLVKIRIENSYVGILEAASDSGSLIHAIFLTVNSVSLIFCIVFCTHKIVKRAKGFPWQNSGWAVKGNHDRSKYHRSITDNHDISKLITPAFASTFQFSSYNSD